MQNKNHWYRNFRFKLFVVLCAIAVLASAVFVNQRPALARQAVANDNNAAASFPGDKNSRMAIISRGANLLDIFVVANNGAIWKKSFNGSSWTSWSSLGKTPTGETFSNISAVAAGNNRWDIFATPLAATNGVYTVWHLSFDGYYLWTWESVGTIPFSTLGGVQAVSTGNGRIDLFTRGNGPLLHKLWTSSGGWWPSQAAWETLDSSTSAASFNVLAHSSNRLDIFRRLDSNQSINRKYWDGAQWRPTLGGIDTWDNMSGGLTLNTPYAVSWGTNRIDAFVRGTDGNIWIDNTNDAGAHWFGWSPIGVGNSPTYADTSPSAVAWGSNRLDIFELDSGNVYHKAWTGTIWWPSQSGWENIGTNPGAYNIPPTAVSWSANRIDLFQFQTNNGEVFHKWYDGTSWGPSQTGWEDLGHAYP